MPALAATRLLTTAEVAELLNVHVDTVRAWVAAGALRAIRVGERGRLRFREDEVRALLEGQAPDREDDPA